MPTLLQIALNEEASEFVRGKVASGEYAAEADVINDLVKWKREDDEEQRRFEQEVVIPTHDALMADPFSAIPIAQVERNLEAARRQRLKAS